MQRGFSKIVESASRRGAVLGVFGLFLISAACASVLLNIKPDTKVVTISGAPIKSTGVLGAQTVSVGKGASSPKDTSPPKPGSTLNSSKKTISIPKATSPTSNAVTPAPTPTPAPNPNGYPPRWANPAADTILDTWGMYNRESVSYTAWKVDETFNDMPKWGLLPNQCTAQGKSYPAGDAICWPSDAKNSGFTVSPAPKAHSVGIFASPAAALHSGFSAWIESTDGTNVTYSSYNCDGTFNFCTNTVSKNYFNAGYIYF